METAEETKIQFEAFLKEECFDDKLAIILDQIDTCSDIDECRLLFKSLADLFSRAMARFVARQVVRKMCNDLRIGGNAKD